ncbi:condensation domain-containing protein, partial [Rheinheimera gaetbuli]
PMVHNLPLDKARPRVQTFMGASYFNQLNKAGTDSFNQLCQAQGATLFMGLHGLFSTLLARYSNTTDIVIGSPIANREQAEVSGLLGFFVNTLVLRSDLSGNPNFMGLLEQSKRVLLDAYGHQQVPFEKVVETLQPERSLSHSPLFQVMLSLENNEEGELNLPGLRLSPMAAGAEVAKFDLSLTVSVGEQGMGLNWNYNTDLFHEQTIVRLASHFMNLLQAVSAEPEQGVMSLPLVVG